MNLDKIVYVFVWLEKIVLFMNGYVFLGLPNSASARLLIDIWRHKSTEHSIDNGNHVRNQLKTSDGLNAAISISSIVLPPQVSLIIGNRQRQERYKLSLPLEPDMTVLQLLINAVKASKDRVCPYNVQLQWDETLNCHTILKALGSENSSTHKWQFKIRRWTKEIIYKGECLPRENVTLDPSDRVTILYQPSYKQSN